MGINEKEIGLYVSNDKDADQERRGPWETSRIKNRPFLGDYCPVRISRSSRPTFIAARTNLNVFSIVRNRCCQSGGISLPINSTCSLQPLSTAYFVVYAVFGCVPLVPLRAVDVGGLESCMKHGDCVEKPKNRRT